MGHSQSSNPFNALFPPRRTRSAWNACLENWEKPATPAEEARIERAAGMVRAALAGSSWLNAENVTVHAQGSYHNNTNVRLDADMDLRATHPSLKVVYHENVLVESADAVLGYTCTPFTAGDAAAQMRVEIAWELSKKFGAANVDSTGNKAIHLKELPGSRAEVDVVPSFRLHYVKWNPIAKHYDTIEGIAILPRTGGFIYNFPEQHRRNGVAKRANTKLRFKRTARVLKRLRTELVEIGDLAEKQTPSFLIECLAYGVEDEFFLVESDDRYDRARRIVGRLAQQLADANWIANASEINGVKFLFHAGQAWAPADALAFVTAAHSRLEA